MEPALRDLAERLLVAVQEGSLTIPETDLAVDRVTVSPLGVGESYEVWLMSDGSRSVTLRLPRRRREDMPAPMVDEFLAARFVPDDIGSRAILMDERDDSALGHPYIVSTFVPGRVLAISEWDEKLLGRHAQQLARLHQADFDLAGPLGREGAEIDVRHEFEEGFTWWRTNHPEVTETQEVGDLVSGVRDRLEELMADFRGVQYSFIHGDLVATNVVVDATSTPRYIDWEWARIGDVAQDLAYIGGQVTGGPWYVRMSPRTVTRFLTSYLAASAARSIRPTESLDQLSARRDAWELVERFMSSLHFSSQARRVAEPTVYVDAVAELRSTLRVRLFG